MAKKIIFLTENTLDLRKIDPEIENNLRKEIEITDQLMHRYGYGLQT